MDKSNTKNVEKKNTKNTMINNEYTQIHARLSDAVLSFVQTQLGLNPLSIFIDEHENSLIVTLKNVFSDSEKHAAMDKHTADLITRTHIEAYKSVCSILIAKVSDETGWSVEATTFFLDPTANYASIIITIDKNNSK